MSSCHLQKHARKVLKAISAMLPKGWRVEVSTGGGTHYHFDIHGPQGYAGRAIIAASPRDEDNVVAYAKQKVRKLLAA